ncbi:MAG TPA: protein-disulfide reductase DsbD domain-containing protein [Acetobacteraceae bacterium]|nr:protein-disulfide reductase DsbD domain-containing protein [Acetobacteraceae bacterium]
MIRLPFPVLLLALFLAALLAGGAKAGESAPVSSKRATATLVSDTDAVAPGHTFRVGLRLQLAPGWHTYWKNPGDAGAPPQLSLTLPDGAKAGPIDWPTPQRIAEGPVMTYAYTNQVLLPVTVTPAAGQAGPVTIRAHASWLVCKDICVPEEGSFRLDLAAGTPAPSPQATLFAAHDRAVPRASPWQASVAPDGTLSVRGPELNTNTVADAWFIPNTPGRIKDDAAQPLSVGPNGFNLSLKPAADFTKADRLSGVLSVRDRTGEQTNVTIDAVRGPPLAPLMPPLARVLGFAFLGGLILNLMPCVFPVLAMKAVGLANSAARGQARAHAVSYTTGVLVTFAALAAGLLAARAAGAAAGWGFQFSSPVFVAAMAWLLFGVGLNLSGVFEIGSAMTGAGSRLADRRGHVGSFFTGLLAVLVATPCTAPFMGVAIAAGLAAPPAVTILVFLLMGAGLATPYVVLACIPGLAHLAPRPGRWMKVLKQGLAFPMYGAAAWLLWVVSQEAGSGGVLATAAGFVLLGFAGWAVGISQAGTRPNRRLGQSVATAALLAALAVLGGIATVPRTQAAAEATSGAEAFSPARLAALRAEGRPVFVNVTAAWCVTCLVNERVAIGTAAVQHAFETRHVAYLKGDWTRQDSAITAYLREHGRDGVPLYLYYPPGGGPPTTLPQILTENIVLGVLDRG